ncbi:hypothetical protein [Micromonospora sp. RP3T]|uniref:hypothetical protein n=1 Tax=Micromonospora sp. RP3T TaxID=2135446 RepID=UPI000D1660B8|nr:hypothetical protein [Micromonospora sp. RP3T]PTA45207.1 hypothetical protein C8054_16510 [Micromonospora sp. RP3T]
MAVGNLLVRWARRGGESVVTGLVLLGSSYYLPVAWPREPVDHTPGTGEEPVPSEAGCPRCQLTEAESAIWRALTSSMRADS